MLVTDRLASSQVAHRELMPSVQPRRSKYLNNRAENSHQPTRHRERAMKRFTSIRHGKRFLSAFSGISPHFRPRRHLLSAADYRQVMADRFAVWNEITPGRRPRPPPESATGTGRFVQATAHHPKPHIGQLGWLKLTVPFDELVVSLVAFHSGATAEAR